MIQPVLARDHGARSVAGERRVVAGERGERALGAVLGRGKEPVRALVVVVDVLVVGVLHRAFSRDLGSQATSRRRPG